MTVSLYHQPLGTLFRRFVISADDELLATGICQAHENQLCGGHGHWLEWLA